MAGSGARRWSTALLVGVAACCALVSAQQVAGSTVGAPQHRAVVLVDDGVTRRAHCVVFSGETSGIQALQATPERDRLVLNGFSGMGAAVCSIDGTGCSASQCLTCQAPKYWRYYRAEAGATTFTASGGGASSSRLADGDVDAWVWGNSASAGSVPSVDAVCGPRPTTTTTARPRPAPPPPAPPTPPVPGPSPGLDVVPPAPAPTAPATSILGVATTEPPAAPDGDDTGDDGDDGGSETGGDVTDTPDGVTEGEDADRTGPDEGRDDTTDLTIVDADGEVAAAVDPETTEQVAGGWWGIGAVALVLVGVATWALILRRRGAT